MKKTREISCFKFREIAGPAAPFAINPLESGRVMATNFDPLLDKLSNSFTLLKTVGQAQVYYSHSTFDVRP